MRDDLQGLDISHKELQELTNLPVNDDLIIITNPIKRLGKIFIDKIQGTEGATVVFIGFSSFTFAYLLFDVIIKLFAGESGIQPWMLLILFILWLGGVTQIILYVIWKSKSKFLKANMTNCLRILINDVERYNSVIKAININDQIEEAGNSAVNIQQREKVIEALKLTRSDLVRALKTEKILRENKNFILKNADLFANNLTTLASMQVSEQATEHGRLLNEALQIALDVQYEMKRLQNQS